MLRLSNRLGLALVTDWSQDYGVQQDTLKIEIDNCDRGYCEYKIGQ